MNDSTTPQTVLFPDLFRKPVTVSFDQARTSSDGGAILLCAADRRLGLIAAMTGAVVDPRQSAKVKHEMTDLLAQRVFAIAAGYPDCNDLARLAGDPSLKLLVFRDADCFLSN